MISHQGGTFQALLGIDREIELYRQLSRGIMVSPSVAALVEMFMRLWSSILVCAFTLTQPTAADARGGMFRPMMRPAMAAPHGFAGKPFTRPGTGARPVEARNPEQRFRPAREAFAVAGGGFGYLGYPDAYAGDYGAAGAAEPDDRPPPVLLYRYERPPQLTCFRPRLITIGIRPAHDAHLPKVVYGGPLPCGFKGT